MNTPVSITRPRWLILITLAVEGILIGVILWDRQSTIGAIESGFAANEVNRAAELARVKAETIRNRDWIEAMARKIGLEQAEIDRLRALSLDHEAQERQHGLRR